MGDDTSPELSSLRGGIECLVIDNSSAAGSLPLHRSRTGDDALPAVGTSFLSPHVTRRRHPKPDANRDVNPAGPPLISTVVKSNPSSKPFASRASSRRTERSTASLSTSKTYGLIKGVTGLSDFDKKHSKLVSLQIIRALSLSSYRFADITRSFVNHDDKLAAILKAVRFMGAQGLYDIFEQFTKDCSLRHEPAFKQHLA